MRRNRHVTSENPVNAACLFYFEKKTLISDAIDGSTSSKSGRRAHEPRPTNWIRRRRYANERRRRYANQGGRLPEFIARLRTAPEAVSGRFHTQQKTSPLTGSMTLGIAVEYVFHVFRSFFLPRVPGRTGTRNAAVDPSLFCLFLYFFFTFVNGKTR